MNRLSLRNNRLKSETWGILEEFYRIYLSLIKEYRRMSTCNQLDSQTLGSQPIMPKNSPMVKPILDPPLSHRLGMWGGDFQTRIGPPWNHHDHAYYTTTFMKHPTIFRRNIFYLLCWVISSSFSWLDPCIYLHQWPRAWVVECQLYNHCSSPSWSTFTE